MTDVRVGHGFDVHRFVQGSTDGLIVGGQWCAGPRVEAVSDGDVVAHACAEALLGAAGLGDLGMHFPENDPASKDANSMEILRKVVDMVHEQGWVVGNLDCSVIAEVPKIAPVRDAMQENLSSVVGAPVTVKGRRAEGLGAIGRVEGIACMSVAVLTR